MKKPVSKTKTTCFLVVEPKKIPKTDLTHVKKILKSLGAVLLTENDKFQLFMVQKTNDIVFARLCLRLPDSVKITVIYQLEIVRLGAWATDIVWKHKYGETSSYA